MSFVSTQPLTCVKLHVFTAENSLLGSRFNPLHVKHGFRSFKHDLSSSTQGQRRRRLSISSSLEPVPPPVPPSIDDSSSNPLSGRKGWIAGAVLAFLLPFLGNKWGPLLFFKKEVDEKLQAVENVVETLEKMADNVEHMVEDVAKDLPEGNFKNAALFVEEVAEKVETAAHFTDSAIDKFQELEEEAVESLVEPNQRKAKPNVQEA